MKPCAYNPTAEEDQYIKACADSAARKAYNKAYQKTLRMLAKDALRRENERKSQKTNDIIASVCRSLTKA